MPLLIGTSESIQETAFDLSQATVTIGRGEDNPIVLDHASVSGYHAEISKQDDAWLLRDLHSTNGTRVNGQSVDQVVLRDQDKIQFGTVHLIYTEADIDHSKLFEKNDEFDPSFVAGSSNALQHGSNLFPFKAHDKYTRGLWNMFLILSGLVAIIGVVLLFCLLSLAD